MGLVENERRGKKKDTLLIECLKIEGCPKG